MDVVVPTVAHPRQKAKPAAQQPRGMIECDLMAV